MAYMGSVLACSATYRSISALMCARLAAVCISGALSRARVALEVSGLTMYIRCMLPSISTTKRPLLVLVKLDDGAAHPFNFGRRPHGPEPLQCPPVAKASASARSLFAIERLVARSAICSPLTVTA